MSELKKQAKVTKPMWKCPIKGCELYFGDELKFFKHVSKEAMQRLEVVEKDKEKAGYYNAMYGEVASERDSLKKKLERVRELTKNRPVFSTEFEFDISTKTLTELEEWFAKLLEELKVE